MPASANNESLRHVLVVGGLVSEWRTMGEADWRQAVHEIGRAAGQAGVRWATLVPYADDGTGGSRVDLQRHRIDVGAVGVIVEPSADGRERFAAAMGRLTADDPVNEATVAAALYEPADCEPDLVVVCGPSTQLPSSLVWELAYAELVFTDADWSTLDESVLTDAFEDFSERRRRFGGLDDEA